MDDGGAGVLGNRNARILSDWRRSSLASSYSWSRLARSSSHVTEMSASRSSVGSWHRRCASQPHNSLSFRCNSANRHDHVTQIVRN